MSAVPIAASDGDRIDRSWTERLDALAAAATDAAGDVPAALQLARAVGGWAPLVGVDSAARRWELLATLGAADLTVARVIEPHLDAIDILEQAGSPRDHDHTWGVYAAEATGLGVTATRIANAGSTGDTWRLDGVKPWCSLAGQLDRALVTATTGVGTRGLFACSLAHPGVTIGESAWVSRGLAEVRSDEVGFDAVEATAVGGDGWYLDRPGFAWGGIGVAAIWFGASVAVARFLHIQLRDRGREPDQIALMHLGETDAVLHGARAVLDDAARRIDGETSGGSGDPAVLAQRVRSTVSAAAERILTIAGHAMGPAPLAFDEPHARRVADLQLFLRQDHAERDLARLGASIMTIDGAPW